MQHKSDQIRIKHMIDAAKEALSFIKGVSKEEFLKSRLLQLSLTKELEIIGEASEKVSDEFKEKYSDVPWGQIIGMRNRLTHGYFDIDANVVWKTVNKDLPVLIKLLK